MKRFFKIFIPIILSIAILLCIGWYLFIYDRDFTRDMLLQGARFFEDQGNHTVSNWFYDQAYQQADNNDAVAIELANQHKASGNYTKAEYTLTKAISDGGSAELYIALCKTYAEQDKLLDVVKFLDAALSEESSIDPQVKEQLQQLRPAAPTATPDVGFYSQYISAEITCDSGTLYVNAEGEYPSIYDMPYAGAIPLEDGENTIYALAVADNGLVSPLSIFGYTIGGVIKEVEFADPAMEEAIRLHLDVSKDHVLYTNDLWELTYFTVPADAKDLSDLSYLTFVEDMAIEAIPSGLLSNLSSMVNLTSLQIRDVAITADELKLIGSLPKLESLTMSNCGLSTISGLENAQNLKYLDLSQNTLRDLTPLASITGLQELYLQNNAVADLSIVSAFTGLTKLDVAFNVLSDLSPAFNCTELAYLAAGNNQLTAISGMENLTELTYLDLNTNQIADVSMLASCKKIQTLDISNNKISSISKLSSLKKMTDFNFSYNKVKKLPEFSTSCALVTIDGSHNKISSLSPLEGLKNLNNVYMDYNSKISSITPLTKCRCLVQVKVFGTKVADVTALLEMDVLVEFDPTVGM